MGVDVQSIVLNICIGAFWPEVDIAGSYRPSEFCKILPSENSNFLTNFVIKLGRKDPGARAVFEGVVSA